MAGRGVLFAVQGAELTRLVAAEDDDEVMATIAAIEEEGEPDWYCAVDKAWADLHQCLPEDPPHSLALLDGDQLIEDAPYIASLTAARHVPGVAEALATMSRAELAARYEALHEGDVSPGPEHFQYLWTWFERMTAFYARAAAAGRTVVFTVDL